MRNKVFSIIIFLSMKSKRLIFFIFISLLLSCKTQVIEFTQKELFYQGKQNLIFTIKNIANQDLILIDPLLTKIEYKFNSEWRNVRILYCPCGASCPQPPEEKIIKNNEIHKYRWNGIEEWCGELNTKGIPRSLSKLALPGLYRIKINYRIGNSNRISKYYKFKIK